MKRLQFNFTSFLLTGLLSLLPHQIIAQSEPVYFPVNMTNGSLNGHGKPPLSRDAIRQAGISSIQVFRMDERNGQPDSELVNHERYTAQGDPLKTRGYLP